MAQYYDPGSPIGQLINEYGQYLKPATPFSQVLPYQTYAAPLNQAYNMWTSNVLRPQFEKFTLNPFRREMANTMATSGMSQMGSAPGYYQQLLRSVESPYTTLLDESRRRWEDTLRRQWEGMGQRYSNLPTTWSSIGSSVDKGSKGAGYKLF